MLNNKDLWYLSLGFSNNLPIIGTEDLFSLFFSWITNLFLLLKMQIRFIFYQQLPPVMFFPLDCFWRMFSFKIKAILQKKTKLYLKSQKMVSKRATHFYLRHHVAAYIRIALYSKVRLLIDIQIKSAFSLIR